METRRPSSPATESEESNSSYTVEKNPGAGIVTKSTWKGKLWDTFDLPPKERKLLFKVDAFILTFASLGYFLKNIDQSNVKNAFVSGMKEDLGMYGNELVTATTLWTIGYVVGQIPTNLLLTRVSARYVIPFLELGWGIATLGSYAVKDYKSLYALRFLVGLFESGFYPGMHYLLGSWYTPRELGKRSVIFWHAGHIGNMFSGFLQAAAYENLDGVHGLTGWRWLFIIDACLTIPIAILGFFCLPPDPQEDTKIWWLSDDDVTLARARLANAGRAGKTPWTRSKIWRLLTDWKTYALPLIYVLWNNMIPQPPMPYWLKSFTPAKGQPYPVPGTTYSVSQINQLPLVSDGIFIVVSLVWAWCSDGILKGRRYPFIYADAIITIAISIALIKLPVYTSIPGHFAIYWIMKCGQGSGPLILAWINEICGADQETRAILVAAGNDFAYVMQAILPNFVWQTVDFPKARKGMTASLVLAIMLIVWTAIVQVLLAWDKKRLARRASTSSQSNGPQIGYNGSPTIENPDDKPVEPVNKA